MNCFHCNNSLVLNALDTVIIMRPTNVDINFDSSFDQIDVNDGSRFSFRLKESAVVNTDTTLDLCKFFHLECFRIVAGDKYVP